ncbi:MAG: phosphoglycolate phosphatase [Burkholderiales bacterium]|nr:phosphoglycolate phosphatase [Burkholderiales bacterium]
MSTTIQWGSAPRAVLFDLDGTLADTAGDLGGAANRLRVQRGLASLPLEVLRPHASAGARGLIAVALDIHPDHPEYETLRLSFLEAYDQCLADTTVLFEGMAEVLKQLESAGLKWGVVTNKPHRFTLPVMRALGLEQRAAVIISGDSTAYAKPHPLPLLTACKQIDVAPGDALYVGDDLRDIQAGRAAGMPTAAAAWGYISPGNDIRNWGAEVISAQPGDLLALLGLALP